MAETTLGTEPDFDDAGPQRRWRTSHVVMLSVLGVGIAGAVTFAATSGAAWVSTAPQVTDLDLRRSVAAERRSYRLASAADAVSRADGLPAAGAIEIDSYWLLGPRLAAPAGTFSGARLAGGSDLDRDARVAQIIVESAPAPSRNPLMAGRLPEPMQQLAAVPLPPSNPLSRQRRQTAGQVASLTPMDLPASETPAVRAPDRVPDEARASTPKPSGQGADGLALGVTAPKSVSEPVGIPKPGSGYALYDIEGQMVYMPNGDRYEAHSGYGDSMDDIRKVTLKMRGPTPPNIYNLRPREALFHGVATLRMTPVGGGKMYGRDGFLVHPFMMGPRGDSNGCVSVKDHDKFMAAYKRGEVTKIVVVDRLPGHLKPAPSLLSWLLPKSSNASAE